jgi:threonine/homoserine/homoserine lactone efflux protein
VSLKLGVRIAGSGYIVYTAIEVLREKDIETDERGGDFDLVFCGGRAS